MWSSNHPYLFKPLPCHPIQTTVGNTNMKYNQILELLPNFKNPKVEESVDDNTHGDTYKCVMKPFVFEMLMNPKEESKMLPDLFCYKYGSTMGDVASLTHPGGNVIFIKVYKVLNEIQFTDGWKSLMPFYKLGRGSWIRMVYVSIDKFYVRFFDDHDQEISYPYMHQPKYNASQSSIPKILHGIPLTTSINPAKFIYIYCTKKTLDSEEALGLKLKLPKSFCFHALTKNDGKISIVDEYYKVWHCEFYHEVVDPDNCWITKGWAKMCTGKKLLCGKSFTLGVMISNATVLYYIP